MNVRLASSAVFALLLPACGGPTQPPDKVPVSSSANMEVPCREIRPTPDWIRESENCQVLIPASGVAEPIAAGIENIGPPSGVIESEDPNYPPRVLMGFVELPHWTPITICQCTGNDAIPWRTNIERFDPVRPYSPAQQDAIVQAERTMLNASETFVQRGTAGSSGQIKELGATINPSALASTPNPAPVAADTLQPSTEPKEGTAVAPLSTVHSRRNADSRGNRRFGSSFSSDYSLEFDRSRNIRMRRSSRFNTEVFGSARAVATFELNADANCSISPPPNPRRAWTNLRVLGQNVASPEWRAAGAFPLVGQFPSINLNGRQRQRVVQRNTTYFNTSYRFMVGPVPMNVRAGVSGEVTLDLAGNLDCLGMSLDAVAAANLNVTASFSINAIIVRAGIEGRLDLINVSLPAETHARLEPREACATWGASHSRNLRTLGGSLSLFTIVGFRWFQTRHNLTIARWDGLTLNEANWERSDQFCAF